MLKLEGRLGGPWVDELRDSWKAVVAHKDGSPIRIDMRGVSYADHRGQDLLRRMEREGASLVDCSDFIRHLLNAKEDRPKKVRKITKKTKKEN